MALKVAFEWLGACSGCEISFLNIGEELVDLLARDLEIVHAPLLMDHKYCAVEEEGKKPNIPVADVGFVSGGVNNREHLEILREMRAKCKVLVAHGTCATHGGIPALMNEREQEQSWREIFESSAGGAETPIPESNVPAPLERVFACDEKVEVDLLLPGCAPNPQSTLKVIKALLSDEKPDLPTRSVCDTCPVERKGKGELTEVRRFVVNADYNADEPLDTMRCLLEQGFMCMGPVTLAGCARKEGPSCIRARVPCRGCFGPVRKRGNQLLDMMNAMASNGIDYKSVVDRKSLLRFSGAHGLLRRTKKRKI